MSKGKSVLGVLILCGIAALLIESASRVSLHAQQKNPAAPASQSQSTAQKTQAPPAAQPQPQTPPVEQKVTGKTGVHAKSINTATTESTGVETPGTQTSLGMAAREAQAGQPSANVPAPALGAPPNWEQIGQEEQLANSNAAAAARAEVGGPEGTLGVGNALPSYAQGGKPTGSSQTKTPAKQQPK